jgi:hypothetical protein
MSLTEDELNLLAAVPQLIGSAVAVAAGSGLIGTGKEAFTSAHAVLDGIKSYPENALIKQLLPDPSGDRKAAIEKMTQTRDWTVARLKANSVITAEKLTAQTLADTRAAAQILDSKVSPSEAREYRQWALAVADKVANAATEGGFLGFGGDRLSAAEKALIDQIRASLGGAAGA